MQRAPVCRLVKWTQESFPTGQQKAELQKVLEQCTSTLMQHEAYHNDARYLRLWIQYVSSADDPPRSRVQLTTCAYIPIHSCRRIACQTPATSSSSSRCVILHARLESMLSRSHTNSRAYLRWSSAKFHLMPMHVPWCSRRTPPDQIICCCCRTRASDSTSRCSTRPMPRTWSSRLHSDLLTRCTRQASTGQSWAHG